MHLSKFFGLFQIKNTSITMTKKLIISLHTLIFLLTCLAFQPANAQSPTLKGLYVNDFVDIIGDKEAETQLLTFAKTNRFNYLLLYNLYFIHSRKFDLTSADTATPLADFMRRAREEFDVELIGGVGETAKSFDRMVVFNSLYDDDAAKLDVFNVEFEFWNKKMIDKYYCATYLEKNNLPCDTSGAFNYYINQLQQVKKKAITASAKTEVYIGKPTAGQCKQIGTICDRVLVHYYRKSPIYSNGNSIYQYNDYRLEGLAPAEGALDVMPIFAGGPNFFGSWLAENDHSTVFDIYLNSQNGFNDQSGSWKNHIRISGQQWYHYFYLLDEVGIPNNEPQATNRSANVVSSPVDIPCCIDQQIKLPKTSGKSARLVLMNIKGNIVAEETNKDDNHIKINTNNINNGVYFLKMENGKETMNYRIVIRHL